MGSEHHELTHFGDTGVEVSFGTGFRTVIGNRASTALISDGGLPHRKTAKSGNRLPIKVLGRDDSEWALRLLAEGKVFAPRTKDVRPLLTTATRYFPIIDGCQWRNELITTTPDAELESVYEPSLPIPTSATVGASVGTFDGSVLYGVSNRWVRPIGILIACLC